MAQCKGCKKSAHDAYYAANRERYRSNDKKKYRRNKAKRLTQARNRHIERTYGITVEHYEELLSRQGGLCAICLKPPKGKSLDIDHCHGTEQVRALLCRPCNIGIGLFKEDPDALLRAAEYVSRHKRNGQTTQEEAGRA